MNIFGLNIFDKKTKEQPKKFVKKITPKGTGNNSKKVITVPTGRVSQPTVSRSNYGFEQIKGELDIIKPDFFIELIPTLRKLYKINEDVGLALFDSIQLTNTGHDIKFDPSVSAEKQDKMRAHLKKVSETWHPGAAGIDGLVNKWIAQIYISGAISEEWVVNKDMTGIDYNSLVNPETIRFYRDSRGRYKPCQVNEKIPGAFRKYIKLNEATYTYMGLFSDSDAPYGIPPFLTALKSLDTQKDMKDNINHILRQLGLLGYLEVTLDKPDQQANEAESTYISRLNRLMRDTKTNVIQGFKEGVVVGFRDDHDFEFHSTTKNLNGVTDLFHMNENQVANGLKTSPSFLGVKTGNTESFLSIVFTKTLSQLKNVQKVLSRSLEKGYTLELMLAGYDPKGLKVEFRPSTVTDDLKVQQGKEIRQRILRNLWVDRIISQDIYAEEMGYIKPYEYVEAPSPENSNGESDIEKKEKREADKDKSDRKVRDKNKPQPKMKPNNTKPV